jgi:ribose transport system ATP-binding protein
VGTPKPPALELSNLSKSFGGVRALDGVDLRVESGEVHGLLGENGSGKSTLIKVLAGYHAPDSGSLTVNGEPVKLPLHPGQFRSLGMDFVHQDLGLIPTLSVVENLYVGELSSPRRSLHISWTRERRRAAETFERYGLRIDVRARVAELTPVERALLAIVRAAEELREAAVERAESGAAEETVERAPTLLVLDEPTAPTGTAASSSSTSPPSSCRGPASTGCSRSCARSPRRAPASSSCRTISTRCARSPTARRCCATAASSAPSSPPRRPRPSSSA